MRSIFRFLWLSIFLDGATFNIECPRLKSTKKIKNSTALEAHVLLGYISLEHLWSLCSPIFIILPLVLFCYFFLKYACTFVLVQVFAQTTTLHLFTHTYTRIITQKYIYRYSNVCMYAFSLLLLCFPLD